MVLFQEQHEVSSNRAHASATVGTLYSEMQYCLVRYIFVVNWSHLSIIYHGLPKQSPGPNISNEIFAQVFLVILKKMLQIYKNIFPRYYRYCHVISKMIFSRQVTLLCDGSFVHGEHDMNIVHRKHFFKIFY